jgi:hypothetical protein
VDRPHPTALVFACTHRAHLAASPTRVLYLAARRLDAPDTALAWLLERCHQIADQLDPRPARRLRLRTAHADFWATAERGLWHRGHFTVDIADPETVHELRVQQIREAR